MSNLYAKIVVSHLTNKERYDHRKNIDGNPILTPDESKNVSGSV